MCLIVFDWQPGQPRWLTLSANRDEFWQRPSQPLHRWSDMPQIIAGRDSEQGGTWLGINDRGWFAALTNVRAPGSEPENPPSRGYLVSEYLAGDQTAGVYADTLSGKAQIYAPFNLLLGNSRQLFYLSNYPYPAVQQVAPGIHTLSNASLDTRWPKTQLAAEQLIRWQQQNNPPETLAQLLEHKEIFADELLPNTGVPLEWERRLSAQLIITDAYGTRCSTGLYGNGECLHIDEISRNNQGAASEQNQYFVSTA